MQFNAMQSLCANVQDKYFYRRAITLVLGAAALLLAGFAAADPPSRVARLSYISGAVSFSPAGEDDWVEAGINRPLITGDRLWVDSGSRAELQIGSAVFHLASGTSVTLLNLDNRVAQLEVTQGTVNAQVRRLGSREVVEIDTPNLAYSIRKPGGYRVDVDPQRDTTNVFTRKGQGEVYGDGASYLVNAGQTYRFYGTDVRDYDYLEPSRADEFDRWSDERNRRADNSVSARYVSRDVIGYEDLDEYGSWRRDASYGNVWVPNRVPSGWAPYRDGHWSWVEPWGWTWIDDAPWGFAVSHYGRWANLNGNWGWVPGPAKAQPVYAPALVAFIGGVIAGAVISNSNAGNVGWFPLGPRDVYRPSYPVSQGYFNNVNRSNTTINNTTITNVYNTKVTNITYVNQRVPGAVVAVPADSFRRSHSVAKSRVEMSRDAVAKARVTQVAAVAPDRASVHGGRPDGRKPPQQAQARPVVAKERPPAAPVSFAARERGLAAHPGRPLDAAALKALKPVAVAPAAAVKVVAPPARPAAAPPPKPKVAPEAPQSDARKGRQRPDAEKGRTLDTKKGPPDADKGRPAEATKSTPPAEAETKKGPPDANKGRPAEAAKGTPPADAGKGRPSDTKKGQPDAEKGGQSDTKKGPPEAERGRAPEAPKGSPAAEAVKGVPEAVKGRPTDATKGAPSPQAEKGRPADDRKGTPAPDGRRGSPSEGRKGPQSPEPQKAPPPPEAPKAAPPVSVTRPPEPPKAPPPDERKAPPPVNVPRPPEQPKAAPQEERRGRPEVTRPPETPRAPPAEERKAAPPPVNVPRPAEPPKAPPPEERKAPPPPVQRPPEPPKAPSPPPVQRAPEPPKAPSPVQRAPEPPKAPSPPPVQRAPEPPKAPSPVQRAPEPPKAPSPAPAKAAPTEAQKAEALKAEKARREDRRRDKKDDDEENRKK